VTVKIKNDLSIIRDWVGNFVDASIRVEYDGGSQPLTRRIHNCQVTSKMFFTFSKIRLLKDRIGKELKRLTYFRA